MSSPEFLEIFLSVSLQATIYVLLCQMLVKWTSCDRTRAHIWTSCQIGLLGLVLVACTLPHLRILRGKDLSAPQEILTGATRQMYWGGVLFGVWLTGFLISLIRVVTAGIQMLLFLRRLQPLSPGRLPLSKCCDGSISPRQVKFFVADRLAGPFCWQFQQPVVVFPRKFLDLQPSQLEFILKHELAHLQADHPLHLFVQQIVYCVYWFHPAVFWSGQRTNLAREMMCDAEAARNRHEIAEYLQVLLKVVEDRSSRQQGKLALGLLLRNDLSALGKRARRLTERAQQSRSKPAVRTWLQCCPILLIGLVTIVWLPINALSSPRSHWSACPAWTADLLHDLGFNARDYEVYDGRLQIYDDDFQLPKR